MGLDAMNTPGADGDLTIGDLVIRFLEHRRESRGGWAEITDEDVEALRKIIETLVEFKCEADPDQDRPIQFKLIDRRKYHLWMFRPVPFNKEFHEHGEATMDEIVEACHTNLRIAFNQLDGALSLKRDADRGKKK